MQRALGLYTIYRHWKFESSLFDTFSKQIVNKKKIKSLISHDRKEKHSLKLAEAFLRKSNRKKFKIFEKKQGNNKTVFRLKWNTWINDDIWCVASMKKWQFKGRGTSILKFMTPNYQTREILVTTVNKK